MSNTIGVKRVYVIQQMKRRNRGLVVDVIMHVCETTDLEPPSEPPKNCQQFVPTFNTGMDEFTARIPKVHAAKIAAFQNAFEQTGYIFWDRISAPVPAVVDADGKVVPT